MEKTAGTVRVAMECDAIRPGVRVLLFNRPSLLCSSLLLPHTCKDTFPLLLSCLPLITPPAFTKLDVPKSTARLI